jgi:hypothetical protein
MRQFQTSQIRAAAAGGNEVKPAEEKGVIETYGYLPFFGLGAAALIGKEAFILNEETMLAVNTLSFVFTAYVAVGDSFAKTVEEANNATLDKFNKAMDCVLTALQTYKTVVQSKFTEVEVMKQFINEQHDAAVGLVKYQNAKIRHAAYQEMMTKLNAIAAKESAESAAELEEIINATVSTVQGAFDGEGGAQLKAQAMTYAIENIGKDPASNDPVTTLFDKVIKEGEAAAEKEE